MINISKICDAKDWFDPEFASIIRKDLEEPAKFHRKQWEFAMIILALRRLGFLKENKTGLSLGGGNERVLYSVARCVKKLFVTDLYEENTKWDCARISSPDEFLKKNKPFEVDDNRFEAFSMDMRNIEFPDNTFDFCYSSCAIEHIGTYGDFIKHLNEVYRCLKAGGVYVFTTEFNFNDETVKAPNNYLFSHSYLQSLISATDFSSESETDFFLSEHNANCPMPTVFRELSGIEKNSLGDGLLGNFPHIILLNGKHPYTSVQIVLRKTAGKNSNCEIGKKHLERSLKFIKDSFEDYRKLLQTSRIKLSPFSALPHGLSIHFREHEHYFRGNPANSENVFHSDYIWLDSGCVQFNLNMNVSEDSVTPGTSFEIRVHCYETVKPDEIKCVYSDNISLSNIGHFKKPIEIDCNEDFKYAILCKFITGGCKFNSISLDLTHIKNAGNRLSFNTLQEKGKVSI